MTIKIHDVLKVPEGDGVEVKRLFPIPGRMNFDPFVLWDHFEINPGNGFPDHPHRGFEGITYMLSGGMQHKDNLGNNSYVSAGGAQRFTAGKGIVHSEMPARQGKSEGIQLWVNLSKEMKQIDPAYQQVDDEAFPRRSLESGQLKVLIGKDSPLQLKTSVEYLHLTLEANGEYEHSISPEQNGIVYSLQGQALINQHVVATAQAAFIESESRLLIKAQGAFNGIIGLARPHGEAIRQYGPFVD